MEDLSELVGDENGFEDLDTLFPKVDEDGEEEDVLKPKKSAPKKAASTKKEKKSDEEDSEEPKPKKKASPKKKEEAEEPEEKKPAPKKAVASKKKTESEDEEPSAEEKKSAPKKVATAAVSTKEKKPTKKELEEAADNLSEKALAYVFENYSKKPAAEIQEKLGISSDGLKVVVGRLRELFEENLATGDLTQEQFDSEILPRLTPAPEKSGAAQKFVGSVIRKLNK